MTVREARADDLDQVVALEPTLTETVAPWVERDGARAAIRSWLQGKIEHRDAPDVGAFVAESRGHVVGFAGVERKTTWSGVEAAYLGELIITDESQGHGIGTLLLDAVEDWARSQGLSRICLDTSAFSEQAQEFYASRGFDSETVSLTKQL